MVIDQVGINGVPIACIVEASQQYYIPKEMIISILMAENGRVGMAKPNRNGTVDYGPMQINSIWLHQIGKYGYTAYDLQYNPCINVKIGTWILATQIADGKDLSSGVGNYHSHTFNENQKYGSKVIQYYYGIMHQLYAAP